MSNTNSLLPVFTGVVYNEDFTPRWHIEVIQVTAKRFEVREVSQPSLFTSPLCSGFSLRGAITQFFIIEKDLIDGL